MINNKKIKLNLLIRCDANKEIGFGHLSRCMSLAKILRNKYDCNVIFGIKRSHIAIQKICQSGFEVEIINKEFTSKNKNIILEIIESRKISVLFFDLKENVPLEIIKKIKEKNVILITLDDSSDKRIYSDLVFLPPVPQVKNLKWENFKGTKFIGWEWMPLRSEFMELKSKSQKKIYTNFKSRRIKFLVTMGGSDPKGFTLSALKLLDKLSKSKDLKIKITIILGCSFAFNNEIESLLSSIKIKHSLYRDVKNIEEFMIDSDLALVAFGTTAYELAVLGIQSFYYCLTPDHATSAESFENCFFGRSFGYQKKINLDKQIEVVKKHINLLDQSHEKINTLKKEIMGNGALNIAKEIDKKYFEKTNLN